jgi:hypothetical protein
MERNPMTNDKPIMTADTRPTVTIMPTKLAEALTALVPLADAVLDHADQHCRWFDISTAPDNEDVLLWREGSDWLEIGYYFHPNRRFESKRGGYTLDWPTHWRPLPPPPSNPPLPAVFVELGAALERLKEGK